MSRRHNKTEQHFGSDSFLDVLANMVGILIILIVIAGARVGSAPIPSPLEIQAQKSADVAADVCSPVAPRPDSPVAERPDYIEQPALLPDIAAESQPPEPQEEYTAAELEQLRAIEAELAALGDEAAKHAAAMARLRDDETAARQQLVARSQALSARTDELNQGKLRLAGLRETVGAKRKTLSGLVSEFEEIKNAGPPVVEVRHRLTPVSQMIVGDELHFRLAEGRVSVIPLEPLIERLKAQIERQKEWLARYRQHQGSVGPVSGFTLNYVVERQSISVLDEMRHGAGTFRIAVSMWQLAVEPDLEAENAAEALRPGSKFAVALQAAPEKAALTFWVYPDSFALFRKLQAAAQAEGFIVSARPLPHGIPIAGSPHGTRSAGQ